MCNTAQGKIWGNHDVDLGCKCIQCSRCELKIKTILLFKDTWYLFLPIIHLFIQHGPWEVMTPNYTCCQNLWSKIEKKKYFNRCGFWYPSTGGAIGKAKWLMKPNSGNFPFMARKRASDRPQIHRRMNKAARYSCGRNGCLHERDFHRLKYVMKIMKWTQTADIQWATSLPPLRAALLLTRD